MIKQPSSFRDPAGFVFSRDGTLYRQVNHAGAAAYDLLMASGLYAELVRKRWMVSHEEIEGLGIDPSSCHRVLQPQLVPFISYPFEWSFSQLRDAAICVLNLQAAALKHDMVLKDASAYNFQFVDGRPLLIDTLSFEPWKNGSPWPAYRQFCQHFLAPLALMSRSDARLGVMSRVFIDGVPLDLASRILSRATWLEPGLLIHLHLHAKAQRAYAETKLEKRYSRTRQLSRTGMAGIVDSLRRAVLRLRWSPAGTEWADYYERTNYSENALASKEQRVSSLLDEIRPRTLWDLGANTGRFSRLASYRGIQTIAFDVDPAAVEQNYLELCRSKETNLLPLVMDLTNPTAAMGWATEERDSLLARGPADCVMALALLHHLVIANNVPMARVAAFFAKIANDLILEFVPKADSQVQRLLRSRPDIFADYHERAAETAFMNAFDLRRKAPIEGSGRILYWFRRRVAGSGRPNV